MIITKFGRKVVKGMIYNITYAGLRVQRFLRRDWDKTLSILYYHRVSDICQDGMTIDEREFEKQVRYLKKNYQVISASQLLKWLDDPESWTPSKPACLITFDDGYRDNYTTALPILIKYNCPAIFFIATGMIGNDRQFPHDSEMHPTIHFETMSWDELRYVLKHDIEIGVHTQNHADLGNASLPEAIHEIEFSIADYTCQFGRPPCLMSYPYGNKHNITEAVVAYIKRYRTLLALFSAYGGINKMPIDRYDIKRTNIGSTDRGIVFRYKVAKGDWIRWKSDHLRSDNGDNQKTKRECGA
jgi:peptidoglycan/xylan/chitin deacetylase (PgdA/CDA1 family)